MKREIRFIILWIVLLAMARVSLLFPHLDVGIASLLNVSLQLLLCVMCIDIARNSEKERKHMYALFALFFGFSLLLFGSIFVGVSIFPGSPYSPVYYQVYVNKFGLNFVLLFPMLFALSDYFASRMRIFWKYAISLAVTLLILLPLYWSFLLNPLQLYFEPEYATLLKLKDAQQAFVSEHALSPSNAELAGLLSLPGKVPIAVRTVEDLRPFLNEGGMATMFWKPLGLNSIYVNVIICCFLVAFFIANYRHNKPHSAYLDKILIVFFVVCLVEVIHVYAYISSSTLADYNAVFTVAQYVTVLCFLVMVYAFD
jgi:hypothetical protein